MNNPFEHLPIEVYLEYDAEGNCTNQPAEHDEPAFERARKFMFSQDGWLQPWSLRLEWFMADDEDLVRIWKEFLDHYQTYYRPDVIVAGVVEALDQGFDNLTEDLFQYCFDHYRFSFDLPKWIEKVAKRRKNQEEVEHAGQI